MLPVWAQYVVSVLLAEGVGIAGSFSTANSISTWYQTLSKPSWLPPNWLFGPVWTTLYALMGIAAVMVMRSKGNASAIKTAMIMYGIQLFLNAIWTPIFFGARELGWGLVVIVALLVAVIVTTILFYRLDHKAGYLMLPYIAWLLLATSLNAAIWKMN